MLIIPVISGRKFHCQIDLNIKPEKTTLTYLLRINAPVSSIDTILKYLKYRGDVKLCRYFFYVMTHTLEGIIGDVGFLL